MEEQFRLTDEEKLLTLKELAIYLAVSEGYLRKKKDNEEIPYYQNCKGEPIRFSKTEVQDALRKSYGTNEEK